MKKLSQPMMAVLERIQTLKEHHGACGMFPYGPGSWATIRALLKRGLVRFVGYGRDIDRERAEDVRIYDMTADGERELERHGVDGE